MINELFERELQNTSINGVSLADYIKENYVPRMILEDEIMKLQTFKMFEGEDTVYVRRDDILELLEQQPKTGYCKDCKWWKDSDGVEMCRWRKELEERGCDFFDDGNKWIPVSERLPEEDINVLCWYEYFRYGNYNRIYQTYGIGTYCGKFCWSGDITGEKARVIAWMPLPEPYEPQERSDKE